jgi:hypothetical protein
MPIELFVADDHEHRLSSANIPKSHRSRGARECIARLKFFNGAHRFLPTLVKMEGFRVVEVPVSTNPRFSGTSHYGVWNRLFKSFRDLLAVRWMKSRKIRYEISETHN